LGWKEARLPSHTSPTLLDRDRGARPGRGPFPVRIGSYLIEREIARGGMGVVYAAYAPHLDRPVAVKALAGWADEVDVERILLEARATARVRHPGVVAIHDAGEEAGLPYLVLDLVDGPSLKARIAESGPLDSAAVAALGRALADALGAAHAVGLLHRDVKPANVLLGPDGPVLTDFGIAKDLRGPAGPTRTGDLLGTPAYMAPEQVLGAGVDERTDVYGLGATLYEALTGRPPFAGPPARVFEAVAHAAPVAPSAAADGVDPALEAVVLRCLAKDPDARYRSVAAVAAALGDGARLAGAALLRRPSARRRPVRLPRRALIASAGLTAAVAGVGLLGAVLVAEQPSPGGPGVGGIGPAALGADGARVVDPAVGAGPGQPRGARPAPAASGAAGGAVDPAADGWRPPPRAPGEQVVLLPPGRGAEAPASGRPDGDGGPAPRGRRPGRPLPASLAAVDVASDGERAPPASITFAADLERDAATGDDDAGESAGEADDAEDDEAAEEADGQDGDGGGDPEPPGDPLTVAEPSAPEPPADVVTLALLEGDVPAGQTPLARPVRRDALLGGSPAPSLGWQAWLTSGGAVTLLEPLGAALLVGGGPARVEWIVDGVRHAELVVQVPGSAVTSAAALAGEAFVATSGPAAGDVYRREVDGRWSRALDGPGDDAVVARLGDAVYAVLALGPADGAVYRYAPGGVWETLARLPLRPTAIAAVDAAVWVGGVEDDGEAVVWRGVERLWVEVDDLDDPEAPGEEVRVTALLAADGAVLAATARTGPGGAALEGEVELFDPERGRFRGLDDVDGDAVLTLARAHGTVFAATSAGRVLRFEPDRDSDGRIRDYDLVDVTPPAAAVAVHTLRAWSGRLLAGVAGGLGGEVHVAFGR